MKRVLIIAYEFPPVCASGMYHPYYLAKYSKQHGWEPYVLTAGLGIPHVQEDPIDLTEQLDEDHVVRAGLVDEATVSGFIRQELAEPLLRERLLRYRRHGLPPFSYSFPDPLIHWIPEAYGRAVQLIRDQRIEAVLTTSFPFSSVLLGKLIRHKFHIPWIAEFRDLWTEDPRFPKDDASFLEDSQWLERLTLETADRVVGVSEPLTERLFNRLGTNRGKFATIELSYDESAFDLAQPVAHDRFRLLQVGTLYPGMMPANLVKAVQILQATGLVESNRFEVTVAGTDLSGKSDYLRACGFHVTGHLSHKEVLPLYREASLLLLTLPDSLKEFIPSRIFEYMAASRPILGVLPPDSVVADLIRESRTGQFVDLHAGFDEVAEIIHHYYSQWKCGLPTIDPDLDFITRFSSGTMAGRWAELLRNATVWDNP
jgi:glycosyltransferase involved in cell wall biosynthesis